MTQKNVRETSKLSYQNILDDGWIGSAQTRVYKAIIDNPGSSDREITNILHLSDPNKVRPRRKELLDMTLIKDMGTRDCYITGRKVHTWKVNEQPDIIKMNRKLKRVNCPYCKGKGFAMVLEETLKYKTIKDFFKE